MRIVPALFVVSSCAAALAVACSSNDAPMPSAVRLYVEPALAARAQAVATEALRAQAVAIEALRPLGISVELAAAESADIVITSQPENDGDRLVADFWVPVVQLPSPASSVTMAQLRDAVSGELDDWSGISGESTPLRVAVPSDRAPPFDQWWPDETPGVETLPLDQVPAALFADPGVLALVPLDAVNAGMRSLDVDGANIVFGTGDLAAYPLTEARWITRADTDSREFAGILDDLAATLATQLAVTPPDPIIIRATGNILPVRCTLEKLQARGDFAYPFLELGPWLAEADIAVGSLDAAISDAGVPFGCTETFSLMGPAAAAEGFAYAGLDIMTVATNHVKDCGQATCGDDALFDTLANLRSNGVEPVGGGADLAAARQPAIIEAGGVRFAFLGYDEIAPYYHAEPGVAGTAPLLEEYVREDIAAASAIADVVVFEPQWGVEYTADPTLNQRLLAEAAVEAGADLVIGNHPHWVQAAQVIDGVFVAYALGNFLFDQDWSLETQQGVVLEAAFHGDQLRGVRYYPIHIYDETQPRFADEEEARQIMKRIWDASAALN